MTRFVLAAILVVISCLVASNVAIAASNPTPSQNVTEAAQVSMPDPAFSQFRHTDNSSHADQPLPFYVAQVSNVCQTPVGWCYVPFAQSGTPCWCNINGYTYTGYVR